MELSPDESRSGTAILAVIPPVAAVILAVVPPVTAIVAPVVASFVSPAE
jgi:hypothetical protein